MTACRRRAERPNFPLFDSSTSPPKHLLPLLFGSASAGIDLSSTEDPALRQADYTSLLPLRSN